MKKIPQRMCVSCRIKCNKADLIRVALLPDGQVIVDPTGKKPGRGAYVCRKKECLTQAIKTHRFDRGLKKEVSSEVIEALMRHAEGYLEEKEDKQGEE